MFPDSFELDQPYKGEAIDEVCGVLLPEDYLAFMHEHNGGEGDIGENYLVLFPLEELAAVNDNYDTENTMPGCVIIGGDGGGELYGVDENGRYFNIPAPDMGAEKASYLGDKFEDLVRNIVAFRENGG